MWLTYRGFENNKRNQTQMANLLEYTLSLRDQMSANLSRIGINSDAALNRFANLERQSIEVNNTLAGMGRSVGYLKEKLALLRAEREWLPEKNITVIKKYNDEIRKLEGQINRLETTSGNKTGQWFREAFQSIPFAGLLTNPLVVAGAAAGKALKLGIEQDLQNTSFQVLLGSEEAAKKMVQDIADYGKVTPYDKMGVGENAKTMLSFGIDEAKIMPTLQAIGDIAMGDANKMSSLTLAFSQMSSTGKLMGQDLLQMINAGFNPLNEISKKTGKSIGDLKKEMEKGLISTKMVEDAYMSATVEGGQFHNMANKMGQTLGGRWAQFMDTVNEKFLTFYNVIEPVVSKLLELGSSALEATSNGIGWLVDKFKEGNPIAIGLATVLGIVTTSLILMKAATMAQTLWTGALTLVTNVSTAAWWANNAAMLANPITWIIAGVIALIALIGYLVYRVDGWGDAWTHTVNVVKNLWSGYLNYLKLGWLTAEDLLLSGIDKIIIAWYKLQSLLGDEGAKDSIKQVEQRGIDRGLKIKETEDALKNNIVTAYVETIKAVGSLSVNDKGWDDLKGDLSSKFGITDPKGVPGTGNSTVNSTIGSGGNAQTSKSNQAIATGGTKHNYITISLDSLIGVFNNYAKDIKGGAEKAGDEVTDQLLRTLAMATTAGN